MNFKDLNIAKWLAAKYGGSDDTAAVSPTVVPAETTPAVVETPVWETKTDDVTPATDIVEEGKKTEEITKEEIPEEDDLKFDIEDLELELPDEINIEEISKLADDLFAAGDIDWIKELLVAQAQDVLAANAQASKAKEHWSKIASDGLTLMEKINPIKDKSKELDLIKNDPVLSKLIGKGDEDITATMMSYLSEKTWLNLGELIEWKKKEMSQDASDLSGDNGDATPNKLGWIGTWGIWSWLSERYATPS